jgi:D-serine deaminase-like pyridoxal phosphate-dependent protein
LPKRGTGIDEVDTPALIVDLDALERNIARMATFARESGIRLRPHGKTHKSSSIARLQMAAGAVGICCQKVSEAEAFVAGGIGDVLITNEVVAAAKLRRLAALTRFARIGVCIDHPTGARRLVEASVEAEGVIDVYIELDVGAGRCGIERLEDGLELMELIDRSPQLRLAGIQAYHGRAQHLRDPAERQTAVDGAVARVLALRDALLQAGSPPLRITGAGTGTFPFETASKAYDEIQPGSYVFMDRDYRDNHWGALGERFEQSLFVLAEIMSEHGEHVVCDAGHKSHSIDSGMPVIAGRSNLIYLRPSDEHGLIKNAGQDLSSAENSLPRLGEKVKLIPGHCDPTVSCHDWMIGIREGRVETTWPVDARGAFA